MPGDRNENMTLKVSDKGLTIDDKPGQFQGWLVWFSTSDGRPAISQYRSLEVAFNDQYGWAGDAQIQQLVRLDVIRPPSQNMYRKTQMLDVFRLYPPTGLETTPAFRTDVLKMPDTDLIMDR